MPLVYHLFASDVLRALSLNVEYRETCQNVYSAVCAIFNTIRDRAPHIPPPLTLPTDPKYVVSFVFVVFEGFVG